MSRGGQSGQQADCFLALLAVGEIGSQALQGGARLGSLAQVEAGMAHQEQGLGVDAQIAEVVQEHLSSLRCCPVVGLLKVEARRVQLVLGQAAPAFVAMGLRQLGQAAAVVVAGQHVIIGGDGLTDVGLVLLGGGRQKPPVTTDLRLIGLADVQGGEGHVDVGGVVLQEAAVALDGLMVVVVLQMQIGMAQLGQGGIAAIRKTCLEAIEGLAGFLVEAVGPILDALDVEGFGGAGQRSTTWGCRAGRQREEDRGEGQTTQGCHGGGLTTSNKTGSSVQIVGFLTHCRARVTDLTMADIHDLELGFAKNPTLDACLPLCDAYLQAKRFMEAMVVCKKGIKSAQPSDVRGRVMLARIYLEQGKPPKAEAELAPLLVEFPSSAPALELMGRILAEQGRAAEALPLLQRALLAEPGLASAAALLAKLGGHAAAPPAAAAAAAAAPAVGHSSTAVRTPAVGPSLAPHAASAPHPAPTAPAAAVAHPAPVAAARPLEHVSDFFAPETLGFSSDSAEIETAGPGRLTILGFVPKSTGSLRNTVLFFFVLLAAAGATLAYMFVKAQDKQQIGSLYQKVRDALDEDRYPRYREVLELGEKILKVNATHTLALSAMAYANAVMALDHAEVAGLAQAQALLVRADKGSEENEFRVAARAIVAYLSKDYDRGLADLKGIMDKGGSSALVELEAVRLMEAAHAEEKEVKIHMARLAQQTVSQARPFIFLGWHNYRDDDWNKASKYFDSAVQNVKDHPVGLIGRSLVTLDQGIGLEQKQKDVEKDLKGIFALPPIELSPPLKALAHFARSQLLRWQGKTAAADEDFRAATAADPTNPMFFYRRGVAELRLGEYTAAIEQLRKATSMEINNVAYIKRLADAQIRGKHFSEARTAIERGLQLAPKDTELRLLSGNLWAEQHDVSRAIQAYRQLTLDDGAEPFSRSQLAIAVALRESGARPAALKQVEDFLGQMPEAASADVQARLFCEMGQNYEGLKQKAKALEAYAQGIEKYRFYSGCHFFMCRLMGRGAAATAACKTYLTLDPRGKYAAEANQRVSRP